MAYEAARNSTGDHVRNLWKESNGIMRQTPITGMFRCAANNARLTVGWVGDVVGISKDTVTDLTRVNQERRDRIRLLDKVSR
jgi:hypothetical protein